MDKYERFMSRARAEWRAKKKGKASLWGFENWANEGLEDHHIARSHNAGSDQYAPRVDAPSDGGTSCGGAGPRQSLGERAGFA
jgi:hypothetical protein